MKNFEIGINYEGGKIINHVLKFDNCVGYVNCQIAMDAPYHKMPRVADETIRSSGRSESQFKGYNELKLQSDLKMIFKYIKETYPKVKIVIQVARGRSAESTIKEVIMPVLNELKITLIEYVFGYRSTDYYIPKNKSKFVFFNYGMFAELSENLTINVGQICNPVITYKIKNYNDVDGFHVLKTKFIHKNKNILNNFKFPKLILYGIDDKMKFITPDIYKKKFINNQLVF
jgi:hypothetical protein